MWMVLRGKRIELDALRAFGKNEQCEECQGVFLPLASMGLVARSQFLTGVEPMPLAVEV